MYKRITQNPNYYNLTGKTGQHINDFLSELVEQTCDDLQKAKCIEVVGEEEMDLQPANFGRIAAFYNIKYQTLEVFASQLQNESVLNKKLKGLLEVLALSAEFEQIPIRQKEEAILRQLLTYLTYPIELEEGQKHNSPSVKVNILLQCHFNRTPLNIDLRID